VQDVAAIDRLCRELPRPEIPTRQELRLDPWQQKRPYRWMEFPTRWVSEPGQVEVVPRGAPYLPLNYSWRSTDGKTRHVSEDVIDKCPELAKGWDKSELADIRHQLSGRGVILHAHLQFLPPPAEVMQRTLGWRGSSALVERINDHLETGRMPILKDSTRPCSVGTATIVRS
jgi:hypothetical protein